MKDFNWKKIAERMAVTAVQAAVAFLAVNNWHFQDETVIAGMIGAGLSAAYNLFKQYKTQIS